LPILAFSPLSGSGGCFLILGPLLTDLAKPLPVTIGKKGFWAAFAFFSYPFLAWSVSLFIFTA
jgi:hypothetical protein